MDKQDALVDWQAHLRALEGLVVVEELNWAIQITAHIGYAQGDVRPGEVGRWDLYWYLHDLGVTQKDRLLLTGLTAEEVAREEEISALEDTLCIDRGDPGFYPALDDLRCFERMDTVDLHAEIQRLEALIA